MSCRVNVLSTKDAENTYEVVGQLCESCGILRRRQTHRGDRVVAPYAVLRGERVYGSGHYFIMPFRTDRFLVPSNCDSSIIINRRTRTQILGSNFVADELNFDKRRL